MRLETPNEALPTSVQMIRYADGHIGIRDPKVEDSPVLLFDRQEWDAFVKGVKAGEFDI